MLFSKAELLCTYSSQAYYQAIDILKNNHIQYESKVVNSHGFNRGRSGAFAVNSAYEYLYYIYVHKNDLEKARYLISNARNQ